jgi:hypothetical protein
VWLYHRGVGGERKRNSHQGQCMCGCICRSSVRTTVNS